MKKITLNLTDREMYAFNGFLNSVDELLEIADTAIRKTGGEKHRVVAIDGGRVMYGVFDMWNRKEFQRVIAEFHKQYHAAGLCIDPDCKYPKNRNLMN